MTDMCDACGHGALEEKHGTYVYVWPESISTTPSEFPDSTWLECDACGEVLLPASLLRRIEARRYRLEGLLTPAEIREIRGERSQVEMARFIGVGDKTYTRWENGLSIQTKAMDTLIRAADLCPALFDEIERSREGGAKRSHAPVYKTSCTFSTFCGVIPGRFFVQPLATSPLTVGENAVYSYGAMAHQSVLWTPEDMPENSRKDESGRRELRTAA